MESKLNLEILKNFERLFESKDNYDVIIQAGEEQKEIYAHSVVLCCQLNYFRTAFSLNWAEKVNEKYFFKKPNISPHIFELILRYLYCGKIDLSVKDWLDILKLLIAIDEFGLNTLNEHVQEFLINNQEEFLQNDPAEILEFVFQHETFTTLQNCFIETICQEPDILFETDKFLKLSAELLESLLKREDLALEEIEVWNNLVKWAHAQHSTIDTDASKRSEEESTLMEKTISRFIPLIRFQDITSNEFTCGILVPYEDLLLKKLEHEVLTSYLIPVTKQLGSLPFRSSFKLDSTIINNNYISLFVSWIDRKMKDEIINLRKIPYKFNLILRGSRDGFDSNLFHAKCDNKGATIVIAKIKGTNQIVGGYNPLDWSPQYSWNETTNSFIFLFDNYENIYSGKIGRVIDTQGAIICHSHSGPLFGLELDDDYGFISDLAMEDGKWNSYTCCYPDIGIPNNFEIDDYEVFQIAEKNKKIY